VPVLTALDVLAIQSFVFGTNRLRDAITGSSLVEWATDADGALRRARSRLLQAAGGNAWLQFDRIEDARAFTTAYTRALLNEAPGLETVVVHRPYEAGQLARALLAVQIEIAREKLERFPSVPLAGLGVNALCRYTRLPATGVNELGEPVSTRIQQFALHESQAVERWRAFLPVKGSTELDFPVLNDDLGRTAGDTSVYGIVHVDGNGVGRRIDEWLRSCIRDSDPDDGVRDQFREWSNDLKRRGRRTMEAVVARVERGRKQDRIEGAYAELGFDLAVDPKTGSRMLPIRPVLIGGDDLTFLCDGRIALDLAAAALDSFTSEAVPHLGPLSACAGVAIVKSHAPFYRAYDLAERLCASAKRCRVEQRDSGNWIDWHIGAVPAGHGLSEVREQQYTHDGRKLTCRPYRMGPHAGVTESWRWLSDTVLGVKGFRSPHWKGSRNKIKELRRVIREGPSAVERTVATWPRELELPGDLPGSGFFDGIRTPLLDAAELLDLYLPLADSKSDATDGVMSK